MPDSFAYIRMLLSSNVSATLYFKEPLSTFLPRLLHFPWFPVCLLRSALPLFPPRFLASSILCLFPPSPLLPTPCFFPPHFCSKISAAITMSAATYHFPFWSDVLSNRVDSDRSLGTDVISLLVLTIRYDMYRTIVLQRTARCVNAQISVSF